MTTLMLWARNPQSKLALQTAAEWCQIQQWFVTDHLWEHTIYPTVLSSTPWGHSFPKKGSSEIADHQPRCRVSLHSFAGKNNQSGNESPSLLQRPIIANWVHYLTNHHRCYCNGDWLSNELSLLWLDSWLIVFVVTVVTTEQLFCS